MRPATASGARASRLLSHQPPWRRPCRLNFFVFFVCATMNNEYMLYYICAMHTFFTWMVYLCLFAFHKLNHDNKILSFKIAVTTIIAVLLYDVTPQRQSAVLAAPQRRPWA